MDHIVATAELISSGHWAKLERLYEPFSPKLQQAITVLNNELIAGDTTTQNFDSYIGLLVTKLDQPVAQ